MAHNTRVSLDTPAEIVTTRLLDVPVALVWRSFTEPDQVVQWWGPVGFCTTTHEMNVRTLVTLTHVFPSTAARDENIATYGSVQGAIDTTNRLAAHLVTMPTERDFIISRVRGPSGSGMEGLHRGPASRALVGSGDVPAQPL
jgi:hypothetical protein